MENILRIWVYITAFEKNETAAMFFLKKPSLFFLSKLPGLVSVYNLSKQCHVWFLLSFCMLIKVKTETSGVNTRTPEIIVLT